MKKKLILIVFMLMLCCGCQANYKLTINEDLSVEEELMATKDASFFAEYKNSSMGRVVSSILSPHLDTLNDNNYVVNNYITSSRGGVIINKTYENLDSYSNDTIYISQFTDKISYNKNGNKITLSAKGNFSHAEQDQERIPVDRASITINVPFNVIENNADKVEGNNYTWIFTEDDNKEREIKLVFDKSKMSGDSSISIVILVIGLVILLVVGFILYNSIRKKREMVNKV